MRYLLIVSAILFLTAGIAQTAFVIFQPDGPASKDASISQANPDYQYGNVNYMAFGYDTGYWAMLIRFNDLDGFLFFEDILYAELNIYCYEWWDDLSDNNYVIRISENWAENTVTWNNRPDLNWDMHVYFDAPPSDSWLTLDVTDIVKSWLLGFYPDYGFYISNFSASPGGRECWSGEYVTYPGLRPKLYISYIATNTTPASLGEVKVLFN
jgi:hypothetical protein